MKKLDTKKKVAFVLLLFTMGLIVLGNTGDGLKAVQGLAVRILDVWQEFISKDVVGIV